MDLTTDSTTDSTTDVTMSGPQTPVSSVDSDVLLSIDPRLLTDQVEVEKSEEARTGTCLAVRAKIVSPHESFGVESTDKDLENQ